SQRRGFESRWQSVLFPAFFGSTCGQQQKNGIMFIHGRKSLTNAISQIRLSLRLPNYLLLPAKFPVYFFLNFPTSSPVGVGVIYHFRVIIFSILCTTFHGSTVT
ncbi:unnamed protein product, partial [Callosobruchus maculatus]